MDIVQVTIVNIKNQLCSFALEFKKALTSVDKSVYKNLLQGFAVALIFIELLVYFGYAFSCDEVPDKIVFRFAVLFPSTISLIPIINFVFKKIIANDKQVENASKQFQALDVKSSDKSEITNKRKTVKKRASKSKSEYDINPDMFIAKCNRFSEREAYKELEAERKEKERLEKYPPLKIIEFKPKQIDEQKEDNTKPNMTINEVLGIVDRMSTEGWKFEKFCAELLLRNGFVNAEVTSGSNDYGADIVAEDEHGIKFAIQCKCYSSKLDNSSIQEVLGSKQKYNCQVCAVITNNYFTNNALELARVNNVSLWDRDKLIKFIKNAMADILNILP